MNYKEIFNRASFAAILCKKDDVKNNQVNQLLSIYNTNLKREIDNTIMRIMAFVMKQRERGYFRKESSATIIETLDKIMLEKREGNEEIQKIEKSYDVREYLGLLKWFFEAIKKIQVSRNINLANAFTSIITDFQNSVSRKRY